VAATRDSVLAHCIARAVVHEQGGIEAAVERYGPHAERLSSWTALKVVAKVTPKASRVATFIVLWAIGIRSTEGDHFSITEYQRYWNESERQAYRLQKEFRELWPEFETPNELARQIVSNIEARQASRRQIMSLPTELQMVA
jgi:hypothetical protein